MMPLSSTAILRVEADERVTHPQSSKCEGGQKVRDLYGLGLPVFTLLNARARKLFSLVARREGFIDDCWANVFRDGEYAVPHSHKRAAASVVYALDPGDEEAAAADAMNGVLMFADPRIEACCQHKPHYVSTPAVPPMGPGSMIIFPAHFTHLVTPYWGRRPRISIAWNINSDSVEGDLRHDGVLSLTGRLRNAGLSSPCRVC